MRSRVSSAASTTQRSRVASSTIEMDSGRRGDVDGAVVGLVGAGFADDGDVGRRLRVPQDERASGWYCPA